MQATNPAEKVTYTYTHSVMDHTVLGCASFCVSLKQGLGTNIYVVHSHSL